MVIVRDAGRLRADLLQARVANARKVAVARTSEDSSGSVVVSIGIVASRPCRFV
jgi:hypothetical protein